MSLDDVFAQLPDPGSYSVPEHSLSQGEPVFPIAVTETELTTLLGLCGRFVAVEQDVYLRRSETVFE